MVNGLPVRADGRNISRLEFRAADDRQGRARKLLAESEIQLADFRHHTVETQMHDALPQHRRERMLGVCQDACAQLGSAPRDLSDDCINAVRRSSRHQADDEMGGVF
jgi:hypothetical protein